MSVIKINKLSKVYDSNIALNTINLTFPNCGIVGVIGPNGSGKTTLFKSMTGLINVLSGQVMVDNNKVIYRRKHKIINKNPLKYISYFPDYEGFYPVYVEDIIEIVKVFYKDFDDKKAYEILELFGIDTDVKIKSLSKGQKVSLNFILTICRDVNYYILDEPFDGIDVTLKETILENIVKFIDTNNKLLIISSHEINDIERILDQFIILNNASLIEHKTINEIHKQEMNLQDYFVNRIGGEVI